MDFLLENQCDYHQNQVHNSSLAPEQTYIGEIAIRHYLFLSSSNPFYLTLEMIRTMLSFSAIHILLVIITFICGLYSIREYRYTYKRLTGMLYIIAGKHSISLSHFEIFLSI